jgi:hypothetical protein
MGENKFKVKDTELKNFKKKELSHSNWFISDEYT